MLWDACLDDLIVPWQFHDNIYLKSIVSTEGKFVAN